MSVDVGSMPPWKRELLERKRRQEDDDKRRQSEDVDRISQLPTWKRDLMLKKHKQKNTMVFMSKSSSPNADVVKDPIVTQKLDSRAVNGEVDPLPPPASDSLPGSATVVRPPSPRLSAGRDTTVEIDTSYVTGGDAVNGEVLEHLIPIQSNPWLKSDIVQRRVSSSASRHSSSRLSDQVMANDSVPQSGYRSQAVSTATNHNTVDLEPRASETQDQSAEKDGDTDSVFGEEEVTYGRGFVHKLLRRFKYMSHKDEQIHLQHKTSPKRTLSSDNILDDRRPNKSSPKHHFSVGDTLEGYSGLMKNKAVSVDNLLLKSKSGSFDSSDRHSTSSEDNLLDDSVLTIVSNDKKDHFEIRHSVQPQILEKSDSLEDLPRTVSAARSVFESKTTRKSPGYKKRLAPETPRDKWSTSSSTNSGSVTSPIIQPSLPNLADSVQEKNQSNLTHSGTETASWTGQKRPQHGTEQKQQEDMTNGRLSLEQENAQRSSTIYDSVRNGATRSNRIQDDINANEPTKPDLRTGSSGVTLTGYHLKDNSDHGPETTHKVHSRKSDSSFGTVNASVAITQVKADQDKRDRFSNHTTSKPTQADSREVNSVAEEIVLELNQSAKETVSLPAEPEQRTKSEVILGSSSSNPAVHSNESSPPRNPEANRLNLNLNLNELNKKKTAADTNNVDINKNNKSVSSKDIPDSSPTDVFPKPRAGKRSKRPAAAGPGSLLVRPASNLVAAGTKTEYLVLNQYHDIKKGEFAPANKPPSYYDDSDDDCDVPVTNIDDYLRGDMPRTNIDDVSPSGTPREGDPSKHPRKNVKRYEFQGGGVVVNRSLLTKTRNNKMRLNFLESISTTFEYPSEQFLLDTMAPEPGDFDYRDPNGPALPPQQNGSVSDDEPALFVEPAPLKSTPGVGGAGSLGSYQSKVQVDYFFGMEKEESPPPSQAQRPPDMDVVDAKPNEEEDSTWSDATSSDMLF